MNDLWECTKCDFKTINSDEAMKHEHDLMNVTVELTDEQFNRAFGVDK